MAKQYSDPLEWTDGELGTFQLTLKDADRDAFAVLVTDTLTAKYAEPGSDYAEIGAVTISDGTNGVVDLAIDATASALLTQGNYDLIIWVTRGATILKAFGPAKIVVSKG